MTDLLRVYEAWELGADGYSAAWHEQIKHLIRAEAEHRCIRCHHPYRTGAHGKGEWSPCDEQCSHGYADTQPDGLGGRLARWRILTVHHLDGDKGNCRWWNLAALCQRCHLTIQGRVVLDRPWHGEHTDWFQPYVAGFYAFKYLGEEIERSEAEARLAELLALEQRGSQLVLSPTEGTAVSS